MNPYEAYLRTFEIASYQELYSLIDAIAKKEMGLDGVPFSLDAIENPPRGYMIPEINNFILECFRILTGDNPDPEVIKLIKHLKENPPKESYENPKLPDGQCTDQEDVMINHIFWFGIDLPGSKYNLYGHLQYYSSFFIDMYFGNYTEFFDHVKSLSKNILRKTLEKREGYGQFSPLFAPILGLRMLGLDFSTWLTSKERREIRTLYHGNNENKHFKILKRLIKLGADVNAHDINGNTPLHYAVSFRSEEMVTFLIQNGANPNSEARNGFRPLSSLASGVHLESKNRIIDILIQNNSRLTDKEDINDFRNNLELYGSKEVALKFRDAHPREKEECEKCAKPAPKMCSACGLVHYCTPACQKLDWKFHKVPCQKNSRTQKK